MSDTNEEQGDDARNDAVAPREPVFNLPPVVIGFILLCTAVYLISAYVLTEKQYFTLLADAAFIPIRYSGQFDLDLTAFTSPLTYSLLHGSAAHLLVNMIWLAAFGSPLANRIGTLRFVLFWAVTSLGAVALHYALHSLDQAPLIGASGAISGMMGAAARFGFSIDRRRGGAAFSGAPLPVLVCLRSRTVVAFLAIWMLINLATGLLDFTPGVDDQIAWEAHIGGFAAGFFGIDYFDRREKKSSLHVDTADEFDGENRAG